MDTKEERYLNCDGDYGTASSNGSPKNASSTRTLKRISVPSVQNKTEPAKSPVKPLGSNYVMQIVSIGVRPDNIYEAQMLLAPEVDMSSIKITVKRSNLRVSVKKPLNDELTSQLREIMEKSTKDDLVRKTMKHYENLLIPENIDGDKVRAVVDNKHRMLILTAPTMKPSRTRKKIIAGN